MWLKLLGVITICNIKNVFVHNPINVTCRNSYKSVKKLYKLDIRKFLLPPVP